MLRFSRSGRDYVLRRGPRHLRTRSNSVILRETKVLAALAGSDVPHPHLIATCEDTSVLGDAVFYLMEPIDGFNAGEGLPPLHAGDPEVRYQMGLSMADALAKLGAVDHVAVGLADFGKPEGFLERQVPRWLSELASYQEYDNYPGPQIPGVEQVAAWLDEHRPANWTPGIMHGDYHAANVMFSHRARRWSPSSTGRCAPSVTRCWTWAGCWPPGASRTGRRCSATPSAVRRGWPAPTSCCSAMPTTPSATCRDHLVHGVGLFQARHRHRGHAGTCLRGQGREGGR